ncbi:MAG: CPBP family intramembrane metalloprotease [Armatimonadetes bacterium]|nr:CPBP family intramembrane metalloprotease [Armatimonadota bacterium]MDW8027342.1 CPBP family intramembrane glutamic endopeptidase [Armatimonadota bacterium]
MKYAAKSLVIIFAGILLTIACYFAPYNQHTQWFQWCLWGFLCGFLLPVSIAFALGFSIKDLGLTTGDFKFGAMSVLVGLAVMLFLGFWASLQPDFQAYYITIALQHKSSPISFWLSLLAYMTGWEFLFRGFLLFGLAGKPKKVELVPRTLKVWSAIGFSTFLFGLSHWGKPLLELLGSFIAGVVLCLIAWRTRSCLAPILLHTFVFGMFTVTVQLRLQF